MRFELANINRRIRRGQVTRSSVDHFILNFTMRLVRCQPSHLNLYHLAGPFVPHRYKSRRLSAAQSRLNLSNRPIQVTIPAGPLQTNADNI